MKSISAFNDDTLNVLSSLLKPVQFKKKEFMVLEGETCKSVYFISQGLTRSFWLRDGNEITTSFAGEGATVFSMDELYNGEPSQEYVQAIEKTIAYKISIRDFNRLVSERLDLCNYFLKLHQKEYRRIHQSHMERLTLSASDRYDAFCRMFPNIERRANLSYIASYLGISQATLSRLRGKRCKI